MGQSWDKTKIIVRSGFDHYRTWARVQLPHFMAGFVRVVIWSLAVAVAFWPSIVLSKAPLTIFPSVLGASVYSAGHFKDFFFVSIVVCIIGISNIFDNAASAWRTGHKWGYMSFIAFVLLGVFFLGHLFLYSIPHFIEIAGSSSSLNQSVLSHDYDIIENILLAGLATELVIAMREPPAYLDVQGSAVGT